MGVEGCTKCIKYLLFFFNFIFWTERAVARLLRHPPNLVTAPMNTNKLLLL